MKGAAALIHFATGGEGVLREGGEQAVAVLGQDVMGWLKVEEDGKGSGPSGPQCWSQSKNGPEDLMGHHGQVGWDGLLRWQTRKMKRKPEITDGLQGSMGRIEMGRERKNIIVFTIFWFKEMGSKSKVLNISKPNLNWIQNRIKSNQLFRTFFNLEIDLNNQI
jgi:hypothetical protein